MRNKALLFIFVLLVIFITSSSAAVTPQVSAGYYHTVGLKSDGTVVAVGNNDYGQCDVSGWNIIRRICSGTVKLEGAGLKDVAISGLQVNPVTNDSGYYVAYANSGWSGTAAPILSGYTFIPASRNYFSVTSHQFDQDYSAFMIIPITVTSPNGGESWYTGTNHDITWTTTGTVGDVKIEYSTNNGDSYQYVTSSTTNDGTFSWTVPNTPSSQCLVRISEASDGSPSDTSDSVFSIVSSITQKDDLLGTWTGQGVYYRNSDTGSWVNMATPATQITAGDIDNDGIDDLVGIWPGQGGVWVKYSSSSSWALVSSTADWIGAGDMNGDGRCDLVGTWTGQGVYYRNSQSGSWVKMATPATMTASGDLDGDGTDDLIGIWPAQGGVWVKYSSDGTWEKLSSTADWIAAGKMRDAGGSGSEVITLSAPVGGIADGPYTFEKHEDLSSEGPGGWNFVYQVEENLFPQEKASMSIMKMLGPGDPGFKCIEQKNLVPQKGLAREIGKKKER